MNGVRRPVAGFLLLAMAAGGAALAGCRHETPRVDPSFRAELFVAGRGGDLWVLNALDLTVLKRMRVGGDPTALSFNPARDEIYCLDHGSEAISVINVVDLKRVGTIHLPGRPTAIALAANGASAYVTLDGRYGRGVLVHVDLPSRHLIGRVEVGRDPGALAIGAGGEPIVVSNRGSRSVSIVNGDAMKTVATIPVGATPGAVVALPWGHKAFVLLPQADQVAALDLSANAVLAQIPVGQQPDALQLKPDGGELFVANAGSGNISIIDTTANQVSDTVLAGAGPAGMAITPDGSGLFVANAQSNTINEIQTSDRTVQATIPVGQQPEALQLGPFDHYLFCEDVFSNDISVVDVRPNYGAMLTLLPAAPHPQAMRVVWFRKPAQGS